MNNSMKSVADGWAVDEQVRVTQRNIWPFGKKVHVNYLVSKRLEAIMLSGLLMLSNFAALAATLSQQPAPNLLAIKAAAALQSLRASREA
jgi:glucan phosphorylase